MSEKRNLAAERFKSTFIAFLDSDAHPTKNWLKLAIKYLKQEIGDVVGGPSLPFTNQNYSEHICHLSKRSIFVTGYLNFRKYKAKKRYCDWLESCNLIMRRMFFLKYGGMDPKRYTGEDKEFFETDLSINPDYYVKAKDDLHIKEEEDHLGLMAVGYYAILESALRSKKNLNINQHKQYLGKMYSEFSKIAAANPDGWSQREFSWQDIALANKKNTLQALPYNKLHCTSWNVNQASAMILCSEELADTLNVPDSKRVYPLASSETNHMIAAIQRPNLIEPIGLKLAAEYILNICKQNNIKPNTYELYSCFPIAVQMFAEALGLEADKKLTVTGGMSFAGGPLNNYMIHSTVKMIDEIRQNFEKIGLVTGVSGMMTKQAFALWAKEPLINFTSKDVTDNAAVLEKPISISKLENGLGKVIGYTILPKNQKDEEKAVVYIEDINGDRKVLISYDKATLQNMGEEEWVGKSVKFKGEYLV